MKVDGACHCGFLTYEAEVDPATVELCHCTDCQTLQSAAFSVVVPAIAGSFRMLSGEATHYVKTAESGNKRKLGFCPHCGTRIYSAPADESSTFFGLRVGPLKQRDQLKPSLQSWRRSAQRWVDHIGDIPGMERE